MIETDIKGAYLYDKESRIFEVDVSGILIVIIQHTDNSYSWKTTSNGTNYERSKALDIAHLYYNFKNWKLNEKDFSWVSTSNDYSVFYKSVFITGARTMTPNRNTKKNRECYSQLAKLTVKDILQGRISNEVKSKIESIIKGI